MPGAMSIRARSATAIHAIATQSTAQPRYSTCPREHLPAAPTQAASQLLAASTGGGQGIPRGALCCIMLQLYFQAADEMLHRLQCLGSAGKAGPGRAELLSAASTHAGPDGLDSIGQPTASRTHPALENCSQVSHYHS